MEQVSIRASGNKGRSTFKAIHIEEALLEKAKHFLESYQFDLRIRQYLHEDKMENSIGKHKYYILGNEQKYEPGYIVVMKGHPIVFLQGRLQYGFILRLRLHQSLQENEGIFVGTLDTNIASLRLEDVLLYEGKLTVQEPYSKRYATLKSFFQNAFVQDTRLSGVEVSLAEVFPLSNLKNVVNSEQYHTLDFVPEQAGRRRLFLSLAPSQKQPQKQPQKQQQQQQQQNQNQKSEVKEVPIRNEDRQIAIAFKIKGLPDTYELKDEKGNPLGKAAVQTTDCSQLLRQAIQNERDGKKVKVQWYEEFERYKILGLLE